MIDWLNQVWAAVAWNNRLVAEVTHAHLIMVGVIVLVLVVAGIKPKGRNK
jgi:hypothetical protein